MTDNQPRVDSGLPGAGRWKGTAHPEAPIQLFDRMDGTFFHPAPFKTAEKCLSFWSTVEVPDQIIDQLADAYHEAEVDLRMEQIMEKWRQDWFKANPQPKDKHIPAWDAKYKAEHEEYRLQALENLSEDENAERPLHLGEYDLPQLVRAAQIWRHAPAYSRFPEEEAKALDHPIELYEGCLTVDEIEEKYKLSRFHDELSRIAPDDSTDRIVAALGVLDEGNLAIQQDIILNRQMSEF